MRTDELHLNEAVALLARTPAGLEGLLQGIPEGWLTVNEGEGTWSPHQVVAHLIHGEQTNWMPRIRHILSGERRPFDPFDRTGWLNWSEKQGTADLLAAFSRLRRENLAVLSALDLTDGDLDRSGQHPDLGEVRLGELLATWVVHDLDHLGQIARTMAKRYRTAVGPWSAYLSILRDREGSH